MREMNVLGDLTRRNISYVRLISSLLVQQKATMMGTSGLSTLNAHAAMCLLPSREALRYLSKRSHGWKCHAHSFGAGGCTIRKMHLDVFGRADQQCFAYFFREPWRTKGPSHTIAGIFTLQLHCSRLHARALLRNVTVNAMMSALISGREGFSRKLYALVVVEK